MNKYHEIFGICESIDLPELGLCEVLAKIDTGAYSGALHCSYIQEKVRESDGKKILVIIPSNQGPENAMEIENYYTSFVRSSNGHGSKRYLFDTKVVIKGIEYPIRLGVSDRSDMLYEIIIGRRFLNANDIIVDTRVNNHLDVDIRRNS